MSKCDGFLWEAAFEKPDSIVFLLEYSKPFKYSKSTGPKTSKTENKVETLTLYTKGQLSHYIEIIV
jgi:hypothetical protein